MKALGSTGTRKEAWSLANLRPTDSDRAGWTRWQDGWNGVNATNSITATDGQERQGRCRVCVHLFSFFPLVDALVLAKQRLTFPLAHGWSFVDTEDYRKDISAEWALGLGDSDRTGMADEDVGVYE